jgi:hypothetical protein
VAFVGDIRLCHLGFPPARAALPGATAARGSLVRYGVLLEEFRDLLLELRLLHPH